ncbi:DNA translocase FtsK [Mangrovibacterium marinum]|uniref:S-DNA-T family DNA segregation ATPase FtsK/SpoIIIE n=1 Tax=Mangrovibacterium marinum TaxID=1639118 RepID=A0A2T5C3M9_9BACT|nr:DNA translocase FtsK [Mangrovibacterium marinum]PTN09382.1 S-DNA-T family DNA segregation ATPase FtsK/SpoIIIE [Mangrovibacterium marinum]
MAKKKKIKNKNTGPGMISKIKSLLTSEKFRYTLGFLLFVFGLYLMIAFISFLIYGAADQSKLDISWRQLIKSADIRVQNKAGKTGAYLSEVIINRGFGLSSFLFVYLLIISSFEVFKRPLVKYRRALLFSIILIFWISVFLGLMLSGFGATSSIYLGGKFGFFMANWFSSLVGFIGTFFLLLCSLFLIVLFGTDKFIPWLKTIFARKEVATVAEPEMRDEDVKIGALIDQEQSISKVITEHDTVETNFDPDTGEIFNEEQPKIDDRIDVSDVEDHVERQMHGELETADDLQEQEKEDQDGLEMTVEKIEEETDEDYKASVGDEPYDPTLDLSHYHFPTVDLLDDHPAGSNEVTNEELISNKNKIVETLRHYKIEITKIRATIGPTITLYEIVPAPGVRISKIKNLEDDIALSLAALGIRIIAPIPGRGTIGIEVPNQKPEVVSMRSIISSKKFQESTAELPVVLGKTISNETFLIDLAKMPHILVAGATGQGKSVGLNAIITSLLYKKHPSQLKLVMIDPKKVELSLYSTIERHFLAKLPDDEEPIITDIQKVKNVLNSLNIEMDSRYDLLKKAHARNIKEYNAKFADRRLNPEKGHRFLPYIVVIIDEFADLIMTAGKEIELPIARIAQLARAVGIHMIIATQRPSTNIITGVIKANFPARIAFKVASMIDSRTILDTPGANQLIGKGDMLIAVGSAMTRLQCAFVDTPEVERICDHISEQQGYPTAFMLPEYVGEGDGSALDTDLTNRDELFSDAAKIVVMNQMGSTSMIQRKFSIGYNRAGRIMDQLEAAGIVGPSEGSKARQVMVQDEYSLEQLLSNM